MVNTNEKLELEDAPVASLEAPPVNHCSSAQELAVEKLGQWYVFGKTYIRPDNRFLTASPACV